MWHGTTLAVVLPTYNEAGSIAACIRGFESLGIVDDIVVVNNNAHPDTSPAVAGTSAREVHEAGPGIRRGDPARPGRDRRRPISSASANRMGRSIRPTC